MKCLPTELFITALPNMEGINISSFILLSFHVITWMVLTKQYYCC